MRLRWILALAFLSLSVLQLSIVAPLALRNLSTLLRHQHEARVNQLMVAVKTEVQRLESEVQRSMDELLQSQALEDVARDATKTPAPPHLISAAATLMSARGLDVLALLDEDGRTLSSGHLPARLGEPKDALFDVTRLSPQAVVATQVELSHDAGLTKALALVTARSVDYGERRLWAVGGVLLSTQRAEALSQLSGAEVDIQLAEHHFASAGAAAPPTLNRTVRLGTSAVAQFKFSLADVRATQHEVMLAFSTFAGVGFLFALLFAFVVSRRVTKPIEALTQAAREIASGEPGASVNSRAGSLELHTLVTTFNSMTTELKEATDKLVASERVAAWQEVARRLAHEIKNPLTPIRMSLETLVVASKRGPLDARFEQLFQDSAKAMLEEVERLKTIIDEFSQFARLPRPAPEMTDLSELITSLLALYPNTDTLQFRPQLTPQLHALVDRQQLTQVLVNLLKNAQEAMANSSGTIDVRTSHSHSKLIIEVEDDGPGIPEHLQAQIFEPYVTHKPGGTGLGLAIARRLIEEHGGTLEVANGTPSGALFRISLPPGPRHLP